MCVFDTEIWSDTSDAGRSAFFHYNIITIATRTMFFFLDRCMSKTKKTLISCLHECGRMKNRIVIILVKVIQKHTV